MVAKIASRLGARPGSVLRVRRAHRAEPQLSPNVSPSLDVKHTEPGESDARLVDRARRGDADAFALLVRRHLRAAYAVALAVLGVPADAEDACQDAFLAALEQLESCRDPQRFAGWLLRIVRNRAHDLRRSRALRETLPLEAAAGVAGGESPFRDAARAELRRRLLEGLEALTEVQREVLLLHDLEGWRHREIAAELGLPEGTVRAHLFHARRALRARIGAELRQEG